MLEMDQDITESEWLACSDALAMLRFLPSTFLSRRKLRLFAYVRNGPRTSGWKA
jgi:hypothetical protein